MKSQTIYVLSGYSGAGKDTCAEYLQTYSHDTTIIKFAKPGKDALAFMLGVDGELFNDRERRLEVAPNCQGRTYLQVSIDFLKYRDLVVGKDLFPQKVLQTIRNTESDICITDMRSKEELDVLVELHHEGYTLQPIWIVGGKQLESDLLSKALLESLAQQIGLKECPYIYGNGYQDVAIMFKSLEEMIYGNGFGNEPVHCVA